MHQVAPSCMPEECVVLGPADVPTQEVLKATNKAEEERWEGQFAFGDAVKVGEGVVW